MKRTFTKYPSNYVKAEETITNRGRYAPISDDAIYSNISWIAGEIAKQLDRWTKKIRS